MTEVLDREALLKPWEELDAEPEEFEAYGPISDEELTALALAADPDAPLDDDAVPIDLYADDGGSTLPSWYMAPVMLRHGGGRVRQTIILTVIGAFLLIEAFGLCSTWGQIPFR